MVVSVAIGGFGPAGEVVASYIHEDILGQEVPSKFGRMGLKELLRRRCRG